MNFDLAAAFRPGLPPPEPPFEGHPRFNFSGGHIDAPSLPLSALAESAARAILAEGRGLATYGLDGGPQGHAGLRGFVASRLAREAGQQDGPGEVLLTSGSLQALDLVNALFLAPGDAVAVEEASYAGALLRLRAAGAAPVGVRMDAHGLDMEDLERVLTRARAGGRPVRMIYTIPTVQNPTGTVLPENRRQRMLDLAEAHDCVIFEDDCYADLIWAGTRPPSIRALAGRRGISGRVIQCGSFSKIVAPALRVGYLVADPPVIARALALKTDAGSGALAQMVLADYAPAHLEAHVAALRRVQRAKCATMLDALDEHFGASADAAEPAGGIFLWIALPGTVDTARLAERAAPHGIALNPGAQWTVDGPANRHRMRLCFGLPDHRTIRAGIAELARICHAEFGHPRHSANASL